MTIPDDLVRQADQLARRWDRSRSWVIGEAIRRLSEQQKGGPQPGMVAERGGAASPLSSQSAETGRLDPYRRRQLADDFQLSPEARVLAAERTAREAAARSFGRLFISFDREEDYLQWKHLEAACLL
jgi:hypothetical protein